ncbi:MAG: hypothetical protein AB8B83_01690 [Bdellovibrionales bacterium]
MSLVRNAVILSGLGLCGGFAVAAFGYGASGGAILTQGASLYGNFASATVGYGGDAISFVGHGLEGLIPGGAFGS